MAKYSVKILNKGDSVISVTEKLIAVKRKNGEVDIIPLIIDTVGVPPRVDIENIVTITYGTNSVETIVDGENGEIKITTF
jgi:hypothetical protein